MERSFSFIKKVFYKMRFAGKVKNGKLTLYDLKGFKDYLFNFEGDVELGIKVAEKSQSPQQNAYYRVIIRELGKELGYNEAEMHKTIKEKFEITSTKHLSSDEFKDYIDNIIRWASMEMGIVLPEPTKPLQ